MTRSAFDDMPEVDLDQPHMIRPPVAMILFCPDCGVQHIDTPDTHDEAAAKLLKGETPWDNPPHRSHLCAGCGHIWRPSDVPTVGVAELPSHRLGTADSRPPIRLISRSTAFPVQTS